MKPAPVVTEAVRDGVDERPNLVVTVSRSSSATRSGVGAFAAAAMRWTASAGTTPMTEGQAASTASSTSSIRASLASSDGIRAMAGRE